jgi:hypothetical protein
VVYASDQQTNGTASADPINCTVDDVESELSTKRALAGPSNIDQSALELNFDITIVGGAAGRRLATEQVDAILEVVEWFTRRSPRST